MAQAPCYIVTGGAGFVGSNLAAELVVRDPEARIIVIDDMRSGSFNNIIESFDRKGLAHFSGSVIAESYDAIDWDEAIHREKPRAIFHLGAITDTTVADEPLMLRINTTGFVPMLRAAIHEKTPLVYASSAATYGTPPQAREKKPFPTTAAGRPDNVYGFSKWLMECEHRRLAKEAAHDPHIVGLRYFNVFGPGESRKGKMASMIFQLARQLMDGKRPRLFTDGSQSRDQVFVDDVVDCTIAAAGLGDLPAGRLKPGVYNLGSGVATSFNQIVDALRGSMGLSPADRPTDYFDMPESIRAFYQDFTQADMSATQTGLGWRPKWKPAEAIAWYGKWLCEQK